MFSLALTDPFCRTEASAHCWELVLQTLKDTAFWSPTDTYPGIYAVFTLLASFPRTLDHMSYISLISCFSIFIAGIVGMIGAGLHPTPEPTRDFAITRSSSFFEAFFSITNPVFAYAGHFMFFVMVSEMKRPQDAMKAAYTLQTFATSYYAIFAAVVYAYIGAGVGSPAFESLAPTWRKAA